MNKELEMNDQIAFSTLGSSILAYQEQKVVVYSELVVESIKHLITENNNLHEENKAYKVKEDKLRELSKKVKGTYDYSSFIDLKEEWSTLTRFNENIENNLHERITYAFQCDIKSAINKLINYTQYEIVKKEDILQILNEGGKE